MVPEPVGGLPDLCGREDSIAQAMTTQGPVFQPDSNIDFQRIRNAFAIALHVHQPLIPAGGADPATAGIISNLQYMLEHPEAEHWAFCGRQYPELRLRLRPRGPCVLLQSGMLSGGKRPAIG